MTEIEDFAESMAFFLGRYFDKASPFVFLHWRRDTRQPFAALRRGRLVEGIIDLDVRPIDQVVANLVRRLRQQGHVVTDYVTAENSPGAQEEGRTNTSISARPNLDLLIALRFALVFLLVEKEEDATGRAGG